MESILPELIRYLNDARAPLPPISDPDEALQLDSLGLVRLVAFLESECGIRVEDEELLPKNFATLRSLGNVLEARGRARPPLKETGR